MKKRTAYRPADFVDSREVAAAMAAAAERTAAAKTVRGDTAAAVSQAATVARRSASAAAPAIAGALSHGRPGAWISDHYAESEQFTGWNYLAVHALCKQTWSVRVNVYKSQTTSTALKSLKALQLSRLTARKSLIGQDELVPVDADDRFLKLLTCPSGAAATQSGAMFRYERLQQLLLTGSAIVWHVRNRWGLTVQRYVLPTAVCKPFDACEGYPRGGIRVEAWNWRGRSGDADGFVDTIGYAMAIGRVIPAEDLMIVRFPHPYLRGDGCSTTSAVSSWIDQSQMVDRARWNHLHNGPAPSMLVSPPDGAEFETDGDLAAYQRRLNQQLGGVENHGKIAVASFKDAKAVTTTPAEMEYGAGFDQLGRAILAAYGVPPAAIGMQDQMTYGALAAALKFVTTLGVQPIMDLIGEEETVQMAPEFGEGYVVDYECARVDDPELTERQLATDITAGAITKGEIRVLRGREPFGDERDQQTAGPSAAPAFPPAAPPMPNPMTDNADQPPGAIKKVRSYGCLMANLPKQLADELLVQSQLLPASALAGDGLEKTPHVTVKYGILTNSPLAVGKVVRRQSFIWIKLGEVRYFPAADNFSGQDVLYYSVDSPDIVALNEIVCKNLAHADIHPEYIPHVTIAYLKPGKAENFVGEWNLTGQEFMVDTLVYSSPSGVRYQLPLASLRGSKRARLSTFDRLQLSASGNGNGNGAYP